MNIRRVKGVAAVLRMMRKEDARIARGVERGLKRGGLFVQRESQKIVPLDTGALRASARTTHTGKGYSTVVTVSYSMHYAVIQHEELRFRHKPGRMAKYLEIPIRTKQSEILKIVKKEAWGR